MNRNMVFHKPSGIEVFASSLYFSNYVETDKIYYEDLGASADLLEY